MGDYLIATCGSEQPTFGLINRPEVEKRVKRGEAMPTTDAVVALDNGTVCHPTRHHAATLLRIRTFSEGGRLKETANVCWMALGKILKKS